jgi:cytochrome P450
MQEMLIQKKKEIQRNPQTYRKSEMDLLGQLVRAQDAQHEVDNGKKNETKSNVVPFTDSEVLGNSFVLMFAGHETTAGTIHSLLVLMALNPACQRKLQAELDAFLESIPSSVGDYEALLPKLSANPYITAVVNETFRLFAPVPTVPKYIPNDAVQQSLVVNGKTVAVSPGTRIKLCVSSVHSNPRFWPHQYAKSARASSRHQGATQNLEESHPWDTWLHLKPKTDLESFRPERWFVPGTRDKIITPPDGSFTPFSDGPRGCLGKRFAQVELLAVLATIFRSWSVELAVENLVRPVVRIEEMGSEQRRQTWKRAAEKARSTWLKNMSMVITLQLRGADTPLRFVERGQETF